MFLALVILPKVRFLTCFASAILSCLCCSTSDSRSRISWSLSECGPFEDPVTPREADILMALEALELLEEDLSPIPSQVCSLYQLLLFTFSMKTSMTLNGSAFLNAFWHLCVRIAWPQDTNSNWQWKSRDKTVWVAIPVPIVVGKESVLAFNLSSITRTCKKIRFKRWICICC